MDVIRSVALVSSAALGVAMVGLAMEYGRRRDWRALLALGYALSMAYVVTVQADLHGTAWGWRTILALASSLVGWLGFWRAAREWQ